MTPGLYIHRDSPVHAVPAGVKLGGLALVATGLFATTDPLVLAGAAGLAGLGFAAARLPPAAMAAQLRPVLTIALLFFAMQALMGDWQAGLVTAGRFAVLVLLAALVTLTTRMSDMMDTLERALALLRPVGVNAGKVSLMLTLAIRFIPLLLAQVEAIRMAQRARGVERSPLALLVPLMVRTLRMADTLAEALEARGYDPE